MIVDGKETAKTSKAIVRKRKPKGPVEQPLPFHSGQFVVLEQRSTFRGRKIGVVLSKCKYDDGIICELVNAVGMYETKRICIQKDKGDMIEPLSKEPTEEQSLDK